MRLIQNYCRVIRQHRAIRAVAQSQIGKKQMMVHDDDVRIDGPLAHAGNKARLEIRALLTQTSIRTRVDVTPEREVLRKVCQLCPIAGAGLRDPTKYSIKVIDLVEALEHGHAFGALDAMQAGVVVTSLHDRGAKLSGQHVLKKGN